MSKTVDVVQKVTIAMPLCCKFPVIMWQML